MKALKITAVIILCILAPLFAYADGPPVFDMAEDIGIEDAGGYYTGTEVEAALQEIGAGTTLDSRYLLDAADTVNDINIKWGAGANQVSSCDVPDHNGHSVRDTFVHIVNRGVAEAITVTLTGGLGVSWTTGEIYDRANHTFIATEAGSGNVTNNVVNYLKWVSGTTLTLSTSDATGDEVLIAIGSVYDGNINGYREMSLLDESLANIRRCARAVFPTRVTIGMSVHEDTDATNPLDVTMDAGVYCKELQQRITPIEIKSRNTAMVRHFHTGGVWDSDTNAQIETTNYDNGTQKTAIPGGKHVKGLFIYMNGKIGFVYPVEYFNTIAQAQEAALPTMPPGLEPIPKLTAIVYQQGAANFTGAIWQDVRTGISEESFSGVTDHGALAGLSDDDHPQYLLADGTRALGGAWDMNSQATTNVNIDSGVITGITDLAFADGGTGMSSWTQYLISYAATTTSIGQIAIGTDGQILTSGGAGVAPSFEDAPASGAFILDTGVIRQDVSGAGDYATDDFVFGSPQLADDTDATHDKRMWFDKSKGAFRVGGATGSEWDDGNVGTDSISLGSGSTASGTGSIAVGSMLTSSNNRTVAMGHQSSATGQYSIAIGNTVAATAHSSVAIGSNSTASAEGSIAFGERANSYLRGQYSYAARRFTTSGDAQYSRLILYADTTDATPEVMYAFNWSVAKPILPAETAWRVDAYIIATTENCALTSSWTAKGVIHRDNANNTEIIWSSVSEDVDEIGTAATVTMTADDTNESLEINITGKTATNIRWVATVNLTEVGY